MPELYDVHHGDCIPHMLETMEPESVDFSVFSPPFPSLYDSMVRCEGSFFYLLGENIMLRQKNAKYQYRN